VGEVDADGTLQGELAVVGAGDLTFGGRRIDADTVEYTNFDHDDANNLGTAILTRRRWPGTRPTPDSRAAPCELL